MTRQMYHLELITPCFCAGAEQDNAEIRAPSIRGQLRWWFRVIGGNAKDESAIFGAVAADEGCRSSALMLRVVGFKSGPPWKPPVIDQNKAENYVWHFASVSGTTAKGKTGPRWSTAGVVPPQSAFTLHLIWQRSISSSQMALFDASLHAFLALGAIGLRATRGLGAFFCKEARSLEEQRADFEKAGIFIRQRTQPGIFPNFESALRDYSSWFRYELRKQKKADRASPLGTSSPRQSSAVRFRPLKLDSGQFTWLAYEAPHLRVLDRAARLPQPMLESYHFAGQAPSAPETRRRF